MAEREDVLRSRIDTMERVRDSLLIEQSRTSERDDLAPLDPIIEALHDGVQELKAELDTFAPADRGGPEGQTAGGAAYRELAERLIEIQPGGFLQCSSDGSIVRANEIALRLFELSFDEEASRFSPAVGVKLIRADGTECPQNESPIARCLRSGEATAESRLGIRRGDGSVTWARFRAAPLLDAESGKPRGAVVIFVENEQAETATSSLSSSELMSL